MAHGDEAAVLKGAVYKQDGQSYSMMRQKKGDNVKERENSLVQGPTGVAVCTGLHVREKQS